MTKRFYPQRDQVYTLREIHETLKLDDTPHLNFRHEGIEGCVQNAHTTVAEELSLPGLANSEWRYSRTTDEWIPVFYYAGEEPVTEFLDLEPWRREEYEQDRPPYWWATPKGFPREQHVSA